MKRGKIGLFIVLGFITILFLANSITASRIPTVGGDTDTWGTVLNAYLETEHNASGEHTNITATDIITTSPWIDVRAFGATGDGITDDTAAIQAAIDYAQTRVVGVSQAPMVYFPSGDYDINDTIIWKSANLGGVFPNTAVRIYWNGVENGTAITKPSGYAGGASFALMTGFAFYTGDATPRTWLNVTATADNFFILEKDHFGTCTGDAIEFSQGWVNLHLTDLRFDNVGGYAIRLKTVVSQNQASFVLDRFTYDSGTGNGDGFLVIDNTADVTNMGDVRVSDGRIEINGAWETGSPQSIFVIQYGTGEARTVGLHASDITYTDASGEVNDSLFFRLTPDSTGSENFIFQNIRTNSLGQVLGGNWSSVFPLPAVSSNGIISWMSSQGDYVVLASTQKYMSTATTSNILTSNVTGDNASRFAIDASGKLKWSNGSADYETTLYKSEGNGLILSGVLNVTGNTLTIGSAAAGSVIHMNRNNNPNYIWAGAGSIGTTIDFVIGSSINTGTRKMTITDSGYVGIGTVFPANKLNVVGDANITANVTIGTDVQIGGNLSFGANGGIQRYDTGWLHIYNDDWTNAHLGSVNTSGIANVTHNLNAPLNELLIRVYVSIGGAVNDTEDLDSHSFEVQSPAGSNPNLLGYQAVAVDNNNSIIQTGDGGIIQIIGDGTGVIIDTEPYFYRVKVWKLG